RQLAQANPGDIAEDQARQWGKVFARQPQVTADHATDEEAAVADFVERGPALARAHFQANCGQRRSRQGVRRLCHTGNPRNVGKPSVGQRRTQESAADWNQFARFWKGQPGLKVMAGAEAGREAVRYSNSDPRSSIRDLWTPGGTIMTTRVCWLGH